MSFYQRLLSFFVTKVSGIDQASRVNKLVHTFCCDRKAGVMNVLI
ncbi:hypothetical protein AVDCRST_MAG94-3853 [uncultured Leptolyngbya sp.]|uniref:Uncharacterized protein n=1 Tax=uncultured Leptolyngbya sp. TaxID=332963 RepID=A0A6J4MS95_9CYAN|nr:hypothetical protein AVDCRST_MAG94-3853 [uncultured Leptolyngbya sp.]